MTPFVSCVCVSQPGRWGSLQRAVLDFLAQTYEHKELLVVVGSPDYHANITSFLQRLAAGGQDVSSVRAYSLGKSRSGPMECVTRGIYHARGSHVTLWDDEDRNLPGRLATQVADSSKFPGSATALSESLYFFHDTRELFVVNYEQPQAPLSQRCAVGSLLLPRATMPWLEASGRNTSPAARMADRHQGEQRMVLLPGRGLSFMVGVTGGNLRGEELHRKLASGLPYTRKSEWIAANEEAITAALDMYRWDGTDPVHVSGPEGEAFEYTPKAAWPEGLFPVVPGKDGDVERETERV